MEPEAAVAIDAWVITVSLLIGMFVGFLIGVGIRRG